MSQATGNLYLARAQPNDTGDYFCFTTINMDVSSKSTFSRPTQLTVLSDGTDVRHPDGRPPPSFVHSHFSRSQKVGSEHQSPLPGGDPQPRRTNRPAGVFCLRKVSVCPPRPAGRSPTVWTLIRFCPTSVFW